MTWIDVLTLRKVSIRQESWPLRGVFRISRGTYTEVALVVVEIGEGGVVGRGECRPYARYGETPQGVASDIKAIVPALEAGMEREELNAMLAPGAARNAIDCALWDLASKRHGLPVWQLAGLYEPNSLSTAYTLSVDTPANLAQAARMEAWRPLLKLKLDGASDLDRVAAVRTNAPNARLIVDANEAWTPGDYQSLSPELARLGVEMLNNPSLPVATIGLPRLIGRCRYARMSPATLPPPSWSWSAFMMSSISNWTRPAG